MIHVLNRRINMIHVLNRRINMIHVLNRRINMIHVLNRRINMIHVVAWEQIKRHSEHNDIVNIGQEGIKSNFINQQTFMFHFATCSVVLDINMHKNNCFTFFFLFLQNIALNTQSPNLIHIDGKMSLFFISIHFAHPYTLAWISYFLESYYIGEKLRWATAQLQPSMTFSKWSIIAKQPYTWTQILNSNLYNM